MTFSWEAAELSVCPCINLKPAKTADLSVSVPPCLARARYPSVLWAAGVDSRSLQDTHIWASGRSNFSWLAKHPSKRMRRSWSEGIFPAVILWCSGLFVWSRPPAVLQDSPRLWPLALVHKKRNYVTSAVRRKSEKLRAATILFANSFTPACIVVMLVMCLGAHVAQESPFLEQGARELGQPVKRREVGGLSQTFSLTSFAFSQRAKNGWRVKPAFLSLSGDDLQLHSCKIEHTYTHR